MAYQNEITSGLGNHNFFKDNQLHEFLNNIEFNIKEQNIDDFVPFDFNFTEELTKFKQIIISDGSKQDINQNFSLGIIQINQTVLYLDKINTYLKEKFPPPFLYEQIKKSYNSQFFLPLDGIQSKAFQNETDFFRFSIYQQLKFIKNPLLQTHIQFLTQHYSLLDTYEKLFKIYFSDQVRHTYTQICPSCHEKNKLKSFVFLTDKEQDIENSLIYKNACSCSKELYISDFLGLHYQFKSETSNQALTTQFMLILEKLCMVNLIDNIIYSIENNLFEKENHDFLNSTLFILDGTLAIYNHASWLSQAIHLFFIKLKEKNIFPSLISIEKTGKFVEHIKKSNFEKKSTQNSNFINKVFSFNDSYIKSYIQEYDNNKYYGENTYFGKKIYFKNKKGNFILFNILFDSEQDKSEFCDNRDLNNIVNTYSIQDILKLFNLYSSNQYENAFSLLSISHQEVALKNNSVQQSWIIDFFNQYLKN